MVEFTVEFTDKAEAELIESMIWGIEHWGEDQAFEWARRFREQTGKTLSTFPLGLPIAPESKDLSIEIRHLIIGRYRILFSVHEDVVMVHGIRGPYSTSS